MTHDDVLTLVREVIGGIAPDVDLDVVAPDADLRAEADLDSMDYLALVEGIAERTGVEIPEADYPRARSVDDLVAYVTARVPA
jgi:acyl carrier protein